MNKDLLSGIVLICVAAAYYAASRSILVSSLEDDFGPHGLPNILAIALAVAGALLVVRGAWAARKVPLATGGDSGDSYRPVRALGLLAIGFAYVLLVDRLGYVVTIALLVVSVALYEGAQLSWRLAAVAIAGASFLWVLFVWLLDVAQPAGLFF